MVSGPTNAIVSLTLTSHPALGAITLYGPTRGGSTRSSGRRSVDPSSEAGHGDLDHPIVPPLQEGMGQTVGHAHGRLLHLDRPRDLDPRAAAFGVQPEGGRADQVAADLGVDRPGPLAPDQLDPEPQAIREGRRHHAMEDGPGAEALSLESEMAQPRPPALEAVDLLQASPQIVRDEIESEPAAVVDHGRGHRAKAMGGRAGHRRHPGDRVRTGTGDPPSRPEYGRPGVATCSTAGHTGGRDGEPRPAHLGLAAALQRSTGTVTEFLEWIAGEPVDADVRAQRTGKARRENPPSSWRPGPSCCTARCCWSDGSPAAPSPTPNRWWRRRGSRCRWPVPGTEP